MTSHPIEENAAHWWLCCGKWRRLHAIPGEAITRQEMRDAIDDHQPLHQRAACGIRRGWWMPGIASRLGLRRCTHCCTALGIPPGRGTPANQTNHPKETT